MASATATATATRVDRNLAYFELDIWGDFFTSFILDTQEVFRVGTASLRLLPRGQHPQKGFTNQAAAHIALASLYLRERNRGRPSGSAIVGLFLGSPIASTSAWIPLRWLSGFPDWSFGHPLFPVADSLYEGQIYQGIAGWAQSLFPVADNLSKGQFCWVSLPTQVFSAPSTHGSSFWGNLAGCASPTRFSHFGHITLIAPEHPSPVEDVEAIRKAIQGWGTNEKWLISIIGHRNAVQRKVIRNTYHEMYQEDLIKRLESELTDDFERAVCRPADRDAVLAHLAIKQSPTDYRVIVELACVHSPDELFAVKRAYQARYKHCLEEDLAAYTSGDLRKFLIALVGTYKYNGDEIDARLSILEADVLAGAVKDGVFTHDEIIRIISTWSKAQLVAIFNRFKDENATSITKHFLGEDKNTPYLAAIRTAIQCITDPIKYYEKVVRNALNKARTDEEALTRVIVRRAEKDLKEIKDLYYKRNSVSLDHAVANDTSGDYERFLLTLLGKEDQNGRISVDEVLGFVSSFGGLMLQNCIGIGVFFLDLMLHLHLHCLCEV